MTKGNKVISTGELGFILDCGTGEMIKKADSGYKIKEYDNNSGMMLVQSDGAYYLADISDPDTLINPFETAE